MQFDDQQNVDPSGQGNPFDPLRQAAGDRTNDVIDEFGNRIPGGQQYPDQTRQAAGQGLDSLQQQGQQGMGGLGDSLQQQGQQGIGQAQQGMEGGLGDSLQQQAQQGMGGLGDMLGGQGTQPGQRPNVQPTSASADPNNPYGNVDEIVADYGNTQADQGQQGLSNV